MTQYVCASVCRDFAASLCQWDPSLLLLFELDALQGCTTTFWRAALCYSPPLGCR